MSEGRDRRKPRSQRLQRIPNKSGVKGLPLSRRYLLLPPGTGIRGPAQPESLDLSAVLEQTGDGVLDIPGVMNGNGHTMVAVGYDDAPRVAHPQLLGPEIRRRRLRVAVVPVLDPATCTSVYVID
jgi:hypothetical protein